jgi:hypothetical protein
MQRNLVHDILELGFYASLTGGKIPHTLPISDLIRTSIWGIHATDSNNDAD